MFGCPKSGQNSPTFGKLFVSCCPKSVPKPAPYSRWDGLVLTAGRKTGTRLVATPLSGLTCVNRVFGWGLRWLMDVYDTALPMRQKLPAPR